MAVQELHDAGRVLYFSTGTAIAGVTTEALFSMSFCRDGVCSAAATTGAVTSGKKLRLTGMCVTWRNNTAVAGGVTVRCRMTPTGAVAATSPIFATLNATTSLATIGSGVTACTGISDEIELSGAMQWGCTQIAVGAVVGFDFNVIGFEY